MKSKEIVPKALKWFLRILIISIFYIFIAKLGFISSFQETNACPIWFASGFAIAIITLKGFRYLPAIMVGSFIANFMQFQLNIPNTEQSILISFFIASGNTLEALIGAFFIKKFKPYTCIFESPGNALQFILKVSFVSSFISTFFGIIGLIIGKVLMIDNFISFFFIWFTGNLIGTLLLVPLIIYTYFNFKLKNWPKNFSKFFIRVLTWVFIIATVIFIVGGYANNLTGINIQFRYLILVLIVWQIVKYEEIGAIYTVLIISLISVIYTVNGHGIFISDTNNNSYMLLQSFLGLLILFSLFLTSFLSQIKKTQNAVKLSEEKFRSLFESSPDAILLVDNSGKIVLSNNRLKKIFGYNKEELFEKPVEFLMSPGLNKKHKEHRNKFFSHPNALEMGEGHELFGKLKNGSFVPINIMLNPANFNGKNHVIATIRDISESKRKSLELEKAKHDWEDIFQSIDSPMQVIDSEHKMIIVNNATLKLTGLKTEKLIGSQCFKLFHCTDKPMHNCPVEIAIQEKKSITAEMYIEAYNKFFIITATPLYNAEGETDRFIHIMTDITDRKKAEEALNKSESFNKKILDAAINAIYIYDLEKNINVFINERYTELTGYSIDELNAMNPETFFNLFHPNDKPLIAKHMEEVAQSKSGEIIKIEYRFKKKSGDWFWCLSWDIAFERNKSGKVIQFIGSFIDITDRKTTEAELQKHQENLEDLIKERTEELEKAQNALLSILEDVNETNESLKDANLRLEELDQLKSMFIASMSHELRTPLNSIIGFSGILLMGLAGELNEEQRKQLTFLKGSASHLLSLITDIIDVSKIEAGKMEIEIEPVNLKDLINEAVQIIQPLADTKSLELIVRPFEDISTNTDGRRIKQVVVNLLSNAVKFTEKGSVSVQVKKDKKEITVSVTDTGIGINKEGQKKLFTAFTKIREKEAPIYEGTGLGLYLSKKIIEKLNGKIWLDSEDGKGSTFVFTVPMEKELL